MHYIEQRPWGSYEILSQFNTVGEDLHDTCVKKLVVKPNSRLSYQSHKQRSEYWVIVQGEGEVIIDGTVNKVRVGIAALSAVTAIFGNLIGTQLFSAASGIKEPKNIIGSVKQGSAIQRALRQEKKDKENARVWKQLDRWSSKKNEPKPTIQKALKVQNRSIVDKITQELRADAETLEEKRRKARNYRQKMGF